MTCENCSGYDSTGLYPCGCKTPQWAVQFQKYLNQYFPGCEVVRNDSKQVIKSLRPPQSAIDDIHAKIRCGK